MIGALIAFSIDYMDGFISLMRRFMQRLKWNTLYLFPGIGLVLTLYYINDDDWENEYMNRFLDVIISNIVIFMAYFLWHIVLTSYFLYVPLEWMATS